MKKNGWKKVKTINRFEKIRKKPYSDGIKENLIKSIELLGVSKSSLLSESDPAKLRLYLSELIIHRKFCTSVSAEDFISMCTFFLCVIETCEEDEEKAKKGEKRKTGKRPAKEQKERQERQVNQGLTDDSLIVAYYLSRFDSAALKELGYARFKEAFESIGAILNQKASTIKNMRDEFDPYFENSRKGWYQRPMSASRKKVFDENAAASFQMMTKTVTSILEKYKIPSKKDKSVENPSRKTIKISSDSMKEIKAKKI